MINEHKVQL